MRPSSSRRHESRYVTGQELVVDGGLTIDGSVGHARDLGCSSSGSTTPRASAGTPERGCVWAGGEAGQLYRVELEERTFAEVARAPGFVLGLALDGRGRLVLCCQEAGVHAWDGERFTPIATDLTFAELSGVRAGRDALRLRLRHVAPRRRSHPSDRGGRRSRHAHRRAPLLHERARRLAGRAPPLARRVGRSACLAGRARDRPLRDGRPDRRRRARRARVHRRRRAPRHLLPARTGSTTSTPTARSRSSPTTRRERSSRRRRTSASSAPELDRVVAANLGRWHLTLLELGLRGAPLHRPERWALDAG